VYGTAQVERGECFAYVRVKCGRPGVPAGEIQGRSAGVAVLRVGKLRTLKVNELESPGGSLDLQVTTSLHAMYSRNTGYLRGYG